MPIPALEEGTRIFRRIYKNNVWGGSGPGSAPDATIQYRGLLADEFKRLKVASVVDLGCGDWQFSRLLDWQGIEYRGLDVVPELIERNVEQFGAPNIRFELRDIFHEPLSADLLLCKDVLQHWPNEMVRQFIPLLQNFRYALITNGIRNPTVRTNSEIALGGYRPLNLTMPPFNLPLKAVLDYDTTFDHKSVMFWDRKKMLPGAA